MSFRTLFWLAAGVATGILAALCAREALEALGGNRRFHLWQPLDASALPVSGLFALVLLSWLFSLASRERRPVAIKEQDEE